MVDTPLNEPPEDGQERPDFDWLFLVHHDEGDGDLSGGCFTPRLAARLWLAADLLGGEYPGDPEAYEQRLPAVARNRGDTFAERLRQAANELRRDIEAGRAPIPRSTGEAVVLGWILEDALSSAAHPNDPMNEQVAELVGPLTPVAGRDSDDAHGDLSTLYDMLFEDLDFETLYSPELDGIEDSEHGRGLGMESLRPADWFIPYDHLAEVLPSRPEWTAPEVPLVFTLETKVSFAIADPQAVQNAAAALMADPETYFESEQARQDEITRMQLSLHDALLTLANPGGALVDIPGAEEDHAVLHLGRGDTIL